MKWLLPLGMPADALTLLNASGFHNLQLYDATRLDESRELLKSTHVLGIHSGVQLSNELLECASNLTAIGYFSEAASNLHLKIAEELRIPVFHSAMHLTRSMAELTISEVFYLVRKIHCYENSHENHWPHLSKLPGEVRGKTLGIVGYGNVGVQVSTLAEAVGMKVIFFDTMPKQRHGNAREARSLEELLSAADVISLHLDELPSPGIFIGASEIDQIKNGAFLIANNSARSIDLSALCSRVEASYLGGVAIDVETRDCFNLSIRKLRELSQSKNVLVTPYISPWTSESFSKMCNCIIEKISRHIKHLTH
ncbi:NAD(P)-dependent oxidoreductase [uncultured Thalassospira sp.]|uniref:NAD(P)-dependent oxidoreductase n=1 Tax=uncultured Thalassospira sp. TaxID=404382 RepID=UPI0025831CF3|nr:NAD(P)-dependent oxidoreductase [uncultured Thalassospira sp.]